MVQFFYFLNILPCTASSNRMINETRNGKGKEVVATEFYVWLTVDTWRNQKTSVRTLSTLAKI